MHQKSNAAKPKWYVVWTGHAPGIYTTWDVARKQVEGFPNAKYKSFDSRTVAMEAFQRGAEAYTGQRKATVIKSVNGTRPIVPSVSVDAACDMTTGIMEYRGVDTETQTELFRMGPYEGCTNNIGEFLAIVHALGLLQKQNSSLPIYSDSKTALAWLKHKHAKTTVVRSIINDKAFQLLDRAEAWLHNNQYLNKVLKWDTENWGENPADFGRK